MSKMFESVSDNNHDDYDKTDTRNNYEVLAFVDPPYRW